MLNCGGPTTFCRMPPHFAIFCGGHMLNCGGPTTFCGGPTPIRPPLHAKPNSINSQQNALAFSSKTGIHMLNMILAWMGDRFSVT